MSEIGGIGNVSNQAIAQTRDMRLAAANARSAINNTADTLEHIAKVQGKDTEVLTRISATGNLAKGLGVAGMASAVYGIAMAAKNHDINGMIGSLGDLAQNMSSSMAAFEKFPGAMEVLKKFGGPLAIVGGITNMISTLKDAQKNGWDAGKVMKGLSGLMTTVAGVAMVIPGGQPVAAAAGAASAALSLGALAYKHWDDIKGAAGTAVHAAGDAASAAADAVDGAAHKAASALSGAGHKVAGFLGF